MTAQADPRNQTLLSQLFGSDVPGPHALGVAHRLSRSRAPNTVRSSGAYDVVGDALSTGRQAYVKYLAGRHAPADLPSASVYARQAQGQLRRVNGRVPRTLDGAFAATTHNSAAPALHGSSQEKDPYRTDEALARFDWAVDNVYVKPEERVKVETNVESAARVKVEAKEEEHKPVHAMETQTDPAPAHVEAGPLLHETGVQTHIPDIPPEHLDLIYANDKSFTNMLDKLHSEMAYLKDKAAGQEVELSERTRHYMQAVRRILAASTLQVPAETQYVGPQQIEEWATLIEQAHSHVYRNEYIPLNQAYHNLKFKNVTDQGMQTDPMPSSSATRPYAAVDPTLNWDPDEGPFHKKTRTDPSDRRPFSRVPHSASNPYGNPVPFGRG